MLSSTFAQGASFHFPSRKDHFRETFEVFKAREPLWRRSCAAAWLECKDLSEGMSAPIRLKVRSILSAIPQMRCRKHYTVDTELGYKSSSASVPEFPSRRLDDLNLFDPL